MLHEKGLAFKLLARSYLNGRKIKWNGKIFQVEMDWAKLLLYYMNNNSSNTSTYLHIFTCINTSPSQQWSDLWYHEYTQISQNIFLEAQAIYNNFNTVYWYQILNTTSTSKAHINHTVTCTCHQAQGLTQTQRENYDSIGQQQIKQQELSLYVRFYIFFLSLQWMNKLILEWNNTLYFYNH